MRIADCSSPVVPGTEQETTGSGGKIVHTGECSGCGRRIAFSVRTRLTRAHASMRVRTRYEMTDAATATGMYDYD